MLTSSHGAGWVGWSLTCSGDTAPVAADAGPELSLTPAALRPCGRWTGLLTPPPSASLNGRRHNEPNCGQPVACCCPVAVARPLLCRPGHDPGVR